MDAVKNVLVRFVGFIAGGAMGVFLIVGCQSGGWQHPAHLHSAHTLGIIICAFIGTYVATRFEVSPPNPISKARLSPDAERNARAKFLPSRGTRHLMTPRSSPTSEGSNLVTDEHRPRSRTTPSRKLHQSYPLTQRPLRRVCQLVRQSQLFDAPHRLVQHYPGSVEAGDCFLNSNEILLTLTIQKKAFLRLHHQKLLDQLGNRITQKADAGLKDTQLHSIALPGQWYEGKR